MFRSIIFFFVIAVMVFFVSCSLQPKDSQSSLVVASYNVQTLFDDRNDGDEFREFVPDPDGWNSKRYHNRLQNLARVVRAIHPDGPDILVFQEIENIEVLGDLDRYYLDDLGYSYCETARANSGPLSIAVLSKLPLESVRAHSIAYLETGLRPVLEVRFTHGGRNFCLLGIHWKSKRGSSDTELLRRAEAHALGGIIRAITAEDSPPGIIVAGDANENIDEYLREDMVAVTAFMPADGDIPEHPRDSLRPLVVAPWENGPQAFPQADMYHFWDDKKGSYMYRGEYEKIDQIMVNDKLLAFSGNNPPKFFVIESGFLLNSKGAPRRYEMRYANGYSDHLPLKLEIPLP